MSDKKEIRTVGSFELRSSPESRKLNGYASVFDTRSVDMGWFVESFSPGAFTNSLKEYPDVRALAHHDTNRPIARTNGGTLTVREDLKGLYFEMEPIDSTDGNDVLAQVRSGVVDTVSIGFSVMDDEWSMKDGKEFREIRAVRLFELSPVTWAAYEETSIAMRSVQSIFEERTEMLKRSNKISLSMYEKRLALLGRKTLLSR